MEQDDLYGRGDFPLLLNGSKLLRGGGDSLERLGQHRHLLLQAPQQLPGVGLLAHPVQALHGGLQLSDLVLSVPLCNVSLSVLEFKSLLQSHPVRLEGERERGEFCLNVLLGQILRTGNILIYCWSNHKYSCSISVTTYCLYSDSSWFVYNSLAPGYRVTAKLFKYK